MVLNFFLSEIMLLWTNYQTYSKVTTHIV